MCEERCRQTHCRNRCDRHAHPHTYSHAAAITITAAAAGSSFVRRALLPFIRLQQDRRPALWLCCGYGQPWPLVKKIAFYI